MFKNYFWQDQVTQVCKFQHSVWWTLFWSLKIHLLGGYLAIRIVVQLQILKSDGAWNPEQYSHEVGDDMDMWTFAHPQRFITMDIDMVLALQVRSHHQQ